MLTPRRPGFTLPEILVTIAIIAALSVVAIPAVMNKLTEARAAALAETLDGINETVQNYRGNVGRYPRTLSQLSTKPTTGALEVCQGVTPPVNINQWRGPYTSRTFTAAGTKVGDATIQDVLRRVPADASSGPYGIAYVDVLEVDESIASYLESSFDGAPPDYAAGTITWVPTTPPVGTLSFAIPIRGC